LSGSHDKTICLWDVFTAKELRQFRGHAAKVLSVAFSPNGRRVLSSSADKTIQLWYCQSGQEIRQFVGHTGAISQALFSPAGRWILSASANRTIRLWDVETGNENRRLQENGPPVNRIALSPDGGRALSAHDDGLRCWKLQTGQESRRIAQFGGFGDVAFVPDGRHALATETAGARMRHFDLNSGEELRSFYASPDMLLTRVQVSPDGRIAASGYGEGAISTGGLSIWRMSDPPPLGEELIVAGRNYESVRRDRGIHHPETLQALNGWAALLIDNGREAEAELLFRQSLKSQRRNLDLDHVFETLAAMKLLARALWAQRKLPEAESLLRECRDGYRCAQGVEHPDVLVVTDLLMELLEAQGKREEAEALGRQRFEIWCRYLGPGHPGSRHALDKLATSLYLHGKATEAVPLRRQLLEINLRELGPGDRETVMSMKSLLLALFSADRLSELEDVYRHAIEVVPNSAVLHNKLAWLLATTTLDKCRNGRRALELAEKAVALEPGKGEHWTTLGAARYRAGDFKEAITALRKSMELRNGGDWADWFFLAMAHWHLGEKEQARKWSCRADLWLEKNNPNDEELRCFRGEAEAS